MVQKREIDNILCNADVSVKEALKLLNKSKSEVLLVVDENNRLIGTVTDGDVRRALLENVSLSEPISKVMHKSPITLRESDYKSATEYMRQYGIKQIPVVNDTGEVADLILWEDIIYTVYPAKDKNNYVFIPAGGKGVRLDPFTRILPKPLIPIGDKPIIETILERFLKYGFNKFIISLNYKADMIKSYFAENSNNFKIEYVKEEKELGTGGSLSLIRGRIVDSLIISNCDVMTDIDFEELLDYHKKNAFHATVVGTAKNVKIPYGVLKIENGMFLDIIEKPEYDFIVNSGIYIVEPDVINLTSENSHLNMPDLLIMAKNKGLRIGVYPFNGEWIDIGQWEEYRRAIEHIKVWGGLT